MSVILDAEVCRDASSTRATVSCWHALTLRDLTNQALERELADQEIGRLLCGRGKHKERTVRKRTFT